MTREIKFRAWDKKTKTMSIGFTLREIESDFGHQITTPDFFVVDECEIQQFTGLQDKNGKDIYEGDALRQKRRDNCFGKGEQEDIVVIGSPEWYELSNLESGGPEGDYPIIEQEVIGNIYENPELLNHE